MWMAVGKFNKDRIVKWYYKAEDFNSSHGENLPRIGSLMAEDDAGFPWYIADIQSDVPGIETLIPQIVYALNEALKKSTKKPARKKRRAA